MMTEAIWKSDMAKIMLSHPVSTNSSNTSNRCVLFYTLLVSERPAEVLPMTANFKLSVTLITICGKGHTIHQKFHVGPSHPRTPTIAEPIAGLQDRNSGRNGLWCEVAAL